MFTRNDLLCDSETGLELLLHHFQRGLGDVERGVLLWVRGGYYRHDVESEHIISTHGICVGKECWWWRNFDEVKLNKMNVCKPYICNMYMGFNSLSF